jgi:hypothetical protein
MTDIDQATFCWHGACTISPNTLSRCSMEMKVHPRHRFLLLCVALCGTILASSHDARALSIGDSHELGFLWPGIQKRTDNQDRAVYVNHLIGMALGTVDVANGEVYSCSSHGFKSLPAAAEARSGGARTINLGSGSLYIYLFATYNGYGTEVWYVGNLSGIIIPLVAATHRLTGWTLFGSRSVGVPDGRPHSNVAWCRARGARLGATLLNTLAIALISGTAQDAAPDFPT